VLIVLAWLLIVWAVLNCALCLFIVGSATYARISRTRLPVQAGHREAAPASPRDRRQAAREAPIQRYLPRPPEQPPGKRRHLTVVV
jgi:hypothetical protein